MKTKVESPAFVEIPHKADAAVIAYGNTLAELFVNSMRAMYYVMGIENQEFLKKERLFTLHAPDLESLLVSFLSEALFLIEKGELLEPKEMKIEDYNLSLSYLTAPVQAVTSEIKAITFNEMKIINTGGIFQTRIVFDL